ncbi:MAG: outer membrane protein transport protein [Parachlamydiales bacterium]
MRYILWLLIFLVFHDPLKAGGVMLYEISSADTRLGSAGWSSRAEDPSTAFTNPAGMSRLCGRQIEFGSQAIYQHVDFYPNSSTTVSGSKGEGCKFFPSGGTFYVQPVSDNLTLGLSVLSYLGAELVYNGDWVGRYYVRKTRLQTFSCVPSAAYRINDQLSVGVGVNVMYGMFLQKSAVRNLEPGAGDGSLKVSNNRFGVGGVIGLLYEMTPCTRFGAQYLTRVHIGFKNKPEFRNIGPLLTRALADTGAGNSKINLDANIPQSLILSAYHDLDCWSLMADIGWQQWSKFQRISIAVTNPADTTLSFTPKLEDCWHAALGAEFRWNEDWTFSAGIAYDSSIVKPVNMVLDFPVGHQWRYGTGFRWKLTDDLKLDFATELQWQGNLRCSQGRGPLAGVVSGNFRDMYVYFANMNLIWAF